MYKKMNDYDRKLNAVFNYSKFFISENYTIEFIHEIVVCSVIFHSILQYFFYFKL